MIHYHANIHKALKYAVKMDLIPFNPADKVERPKKQRYIADYYRQEELERLLEASKDHPYSLLIQMTAFYGLRRSEALGLKWDAIDFEWDTITIKHIVTNAKIDGKCEIVCADRAKTKSSLRSLPLVSNIREKLLALREQQKENRRVCGNCYSKKYDGYVFVDAMGNIFNPRSVTANFSKLLEQNGLRHIRFHDLRHSCASLLFGKRCASEANSGVAGSQRHRHDGEYLQPFGLQVQDHLGKCNGQYPDSAGHKADRLAHLSSCRKSCTPM